MSIRWPGALAYRGFRRLSLALVLSSFGDWLGFLAITALATQLVDGFNTRSFAVGGVLAFRLLPSVLLAPLVGVVADRFDRRRTMVVCDVLRFGLFLSIPLVMSLTWLLIATALVELLSMVWIPAKEASVPHLAKDRLESANQISLFATYGTAPVAAVVFAVLAKVSDATVSSGAAFALYVNAGTFLFAAVQVARIVEIPRRGTETVAAIGLVDSVREGLRFAGTSPLVRGLLIGMTGALAAAGVVVGNGKLFTETVLAGGEAAFALLFGAVFVGIALGVAVGPQLTRGMTRRRVFGPAIVGAGLSLLVMSVVPLLAVVAAATTLLGTFAGLAYVTGLTLLGGEVEDDVRGRTFGLITSLMRISLLASVTVSPALAGVLGRHRYGSLDTNGTSLTFVVAGLLAAAVGIASYRSLNDLPGVPFRRDVAALVRRAVRLGPAHRGVFVVLDPALLRAYGAALQAEIVSRGYDVLLAGLESGAFPQGQDPGESHQGRAGQVQQVAAWAEHIEGVILPALRGGAVVLCSGYVEGWLRSEDQAADLSRWATDGLRPDLTVLRDRPVLAFGEDVVVVDQAAGPGPVLARLLPLLPVRDLEKV